MKTNYKQSQAAPHAKPIFTVSRNDSTLYVLPAYLAGAVMIRLQHIADRSICIKAADTASLPERFGRAFLGRACNRPWLVLNLTGPCRGVIRSRVVGSLSPREK